MKTFKQFQEEARQLDEALPLLAAVPAALKIGGAALTAYSGLSALNNLRKGKFKQAAFDAIGAIPGGRAFKLAKGLGATKNLARGASALQSANRLNLTGLTPNAYAKGVDKAFDVGTKGVTKAGEVLLGKGKNKNKKNTNIALTNNKKPEEQVKFRDVTASTRLGKSSKSKKQTANDKSIMIYTVETYDKKT